MNTLTEAIELGTRHRGEKAWTALMRGAYGAAYERALRNMHRAIDCMQKAKLAKAALEAAGEKL